MKKKYLLIFVLFFSCQNQTPCDCDRINYRSKYFTNCVPDPEINKTCIGFTIEDTIFDVGCELERGKIQIDSSNKWYEIKCHYKWEN